jgi:transposase
MRERRRAHQRAARRVTDWRRHAHYDAIGFLVQQQQWDVVVASTARFGTMVRRDAGGGGRTRVFGRRMAARTYGWAHYAFNQRLASAAATRGVYVHWTTEDGTSGTCGRCGVWNANLGPAETFVCVHRARGGPARGALTSNPQCGVRVDRDVNGARNNLLCALTHCLRNTV